MDDNQFWVAIWRAIFGALIALILTIGGCCSFGAYQTRLALENGADPIKTACAMPTVTVQEATCIASILKESK